MAIVKTDDTHYKNIADTIRGATGYEDGIKPSEMVDGIVYVYDKGKERGKAAAYDRFWDEIQNYGNRDNYKNAFGYWGAEYIRPKYKVEPTNFASLTQTFDSCKKLKKVESAYFDFSKITRGTYASVANYYTFSACSLLEEIEDIGIPANYSYTGTFNWCSALHTIACIRTDSDTRFDGAFTGCTALENITIVGTIGQNGFNVSVCPLTHDSLMSIINALETKTSGTWSATLGATNLAMLTDAEKQIATDKGWTLA